MQMISRFLTNSVSTGGQNALMGAAVIERQLGMKGGFASLFCGYAIKLSTAFGWWRIISHHSPPTTGRQAAAKQQG